MPVRHALASLSAVAVTAGSSVIAPAAAVGAETGEEEPTPPPAALDDGDRITVQAFDETGTATTPEVTFDAEGHQVEVAPDGSLVRIPTDRAGGSVGSPSARGCKRATVTNVEKTALGYTAYEYNTYLEWCWDRAAGVVSEPRYGHFVSNADGTQYYRQIVAEQANLYAWRPGYDKSGFYFHRQARFENCIAKYGCIGSTYPSNIIRAHSDGTWSWWTGG